MYYPEQRDKDEFNSILEKRGIPRVEEVVAYEALSACQGDTKAAVEMILEQQSTPDAPGGLPRGHAVRGVCL